MTPPQTFQSVYKSSAGIGGYKLDDTFHRVFTFDGSSSGKMDHLVLYRPGKGAISVLRNVRGQFQAIYETKNGGIGGFDLAFYYDRARAFDYDHSGRMDHIICYRPGAGACFILKHDTRGNFTPVYSMPGADKPTPTAGSGIGGWDLRYPWDRLFVFDFDHSKKMDHICVYRRVMSMFRILKNNNGKFVAAYTDDKTGIGGYGMGNEGDYAFAFDWDHTGCQDHIVFVRFDSRYGHAGWNQPEVRAIKHQGNAFVSVFSCKDTLGGLGINNVDLRAFVFDYEGTGQMNHIGCYQPGKGVFWILPCWIAKTKPVPDGGHMIARYWQGVPPHSAHGMTVAPGLGVGNCDLKNPNDRCLAFDYAGRGHNDHVLIYRLGTGDVWILKNTTHP